MTQEVFEKEENLEVKSEEVSAEEVSAEEVSAEEVSAEEVSTEEVSTEEVSAEDAPGEEGRSENQEELEKENQDLSSESTNTEVQALNDKYLRLHAEFDNYRRRTAKESLGLIESANTKLLGDLVEVVENFDRATSPDHKAASLEDFEKGIVMIQSQFKNVLKKFGLESIDPVGEKFDPNRHEALMNQPSEEVAEGNIITVFQKGYSVKEKVIKHAKVIVSAGANS
jgi:molecular chaperone GrpE